MVETYTPKIVYEDSAHAYVEFLLELLRCPSCGRILAPSKGNNFPSYYRINLSEQSKAFAKSGKLTIDGKVICEDCLKAGKETFQCLRCHQMRSSDLLLTSDIADDWYYSEEHLCTVCFESMTAKEWVELLKSVQDNHRYDYG